MPAIQINSDSKMEALEIEDELAEAILDAGPDGLSFQEGHEALGMDYDRFYLVVHHLCALGRVKIERSRHGNQNRIFFPHQEAPTRAAITDKQREVLSLLIAEMDESGLARISFGKIAKRTSCKMPAFAIDRLDYKGFLKVVRRGGPGANVYRVYPRRDGPKGYSPMRVSAQ
jgi:hypothetical protein